MNFDKLKKAQIILTLIVTVPVALSVLGGILWSFFNLHEEWNLMRKTVTTENIQAWSADVKQIKTNTQRIERLEEHH